MESEVAVGDRVLRIREAGTVQGTPILYFHGTPGSRLALAFGDELARRRGCRIISFDRPGYGGSTESSFSLASVARDALAIADAMALRSFSTLGLSGGGPFALATAAVGGDRVARVGVASGGGPFEFVPDALK
jgi:pimeloyl-ACP methyl ester carboxylesterase